MLLKDPQCVWALYVQFEALECSAAGFCNILAVHPPNTFNRWGQSFESRKFLADDNDLSFWDYIALPETDAELL